MGALTGGQSMAHSLRGERSLARTASLSFLLTVTAQPSLQKSPRYWHSASAAQARARSR